MTRAINLLRLALDKTDISTDTVEELFLKVSIACYAVEKAHHEFTNGIEDDDEYEEEQRMEGVQASSFGVRMQTETFFRDRKVCPVEAAPTYKDNNVVLGNVGNNENIVSGNDAGPQSEIVAGSNEEASSGNISANISTAMSSQEVSTVSSGAASGS